MNQDMDALGRIDASEGTGPVAPSGGFSISIMNAANSMRITADVYPENTLGYISSTFGNKIGITAQTNEKVVYANVRTGRTASDSTMTLSAMSFQEGDVLSINPFGTVAAS